jgi:CRISPR-associated protein Csm2
MMEQRQRRNDAEALVAEIVKLVQDAKQLKKLKIEELVLPEGKLDQLARHFAGSLKATQLRRVFHDIKRLEQTARRSKPEEFSRIRTQLALTLPELAYAYGRDVIPKEFYDFMKALLHPPNERFQVEEDVQRLVQILTALLAYHKFHGGR